jgi:hypothetical protein
MTSPLPSTITLYWCPPYSCSMQKRQCEANRERRKRWRRADKTERAGPTVEAIEGVGLEPCDTCPGVEALAAIPGARQPRPASDLLRIDAAPEPREPMRRSARRIGHNVGRDARRRASTKKEEAMVTRKPPPKPEGERYRNLWPNPGGSIVYKRTVRGQTHRISTGKYDWEEAAAFRDEYERQQLIAHVPPRTRSASATAPPPAPARAPEPAPAASTAPASAPTRVSGIDDTTIETLLEQLRSRRDALRTELAGIEQSIAAVEQAAEILRKPAA